METAPFRRGFSTHMQHNYPPWRGKVGGPNSDVVISLVLFFANDNKSLLSHSRSQNPLFYLPSRTAFSSSPFYFRTTHNTMQPPPGHNPGAPLLPPSSAGVPMAVPPPAGGAALPPGMTLEQYQMQVLQYQQYQQQWYHYQQQHAQYVQQVQAQGGEPEAAAVLPAHPSVSPPPPPPEDAPEEEDEKKLKVICDTSMGLEGKLLQNIQQDYYYTVCILFEKKKKRRQPKPQSGQPICNKYRCTKKAVLLFLRSLGGIAPSVHITVRGNFYLIFFLSP